MIFKETEVRPTVLVETSLQYIPDPDDFPRRFRGDSRSGEGSGSGSSSAPAAPPPIEERSMSCEEFLKSTRDVWPSILMKIALNQRSGIAQFKSE